VGYVCLFLGLMATLGSIMMGVLRYWPKEETSTTTSGEVQTVYEANGNWFVVIMERVAPKELPAGVTITISVIVGVIGMVALIWGWIWVVRAMKRVAWRMADGMMRSLAMVEITSLGILWVLAGVGVWFLVEETFLWPLLICMGGVLLIGTVSFGVFRMIVGKSLDLAR
jgi:multisubunit Na+/H+ antiporter MnhG subunit